MEDEAGWILIAINERFAQVPSDEDEQKKNEEEEEEEDELANFPKATLEDFMVEINRFHYQSPAPIEETVCTTWRFLVTMRLSKRIGDALSLLGKPYGWLQLVVADTLNEVLLDEKPCVFPIDSGADTDGTGSRAKRVKEKNPYVPFEYDHEEGLYKAKLRFQIGANSYKMNNKRFRFKSSLLLKDAPNSNNNHNNNNNNNGAEANDADEATATWNKPILEVDPLQQQQGLTAHSRVLSGVTGTLVMGKVSQPFLACSRQGVPTHLQNTANTTIILPAGAKNGLVTVIKANGPIKGAISSAQAEAIAALASKASASPSAVSSPGSPGSSLIRGRATTSIIKKKERKPRANSAKQHHMLTRTRRNGNGQGITNDNDEEQDENDGDNYNEDTEEEEEEEWHSGNDEQSPTRLSSSPLPPPPLVSSSKKRKQTSTTTKQQNNNNNNNRKVARTTAESSGSTPSSPAMLASSPSLSSSYSTNFHQLKSSRISPTLGAIGHHHHAAIMNAAATLTAAAAVVGATTATTAAGDMSPVHRPAPVRPTAASSSSSAFQIEAMGGHTDDAVDEVDISHQEAYYAKWIDTLDTQQLLVVHAAATKALNLRLSALSHRCAK